MSCTKAFGVGHQTSTFVQEEEGCGNRLRLVHVPHAGFAFVEYSITRGERPLACPPSNQINPLCSYATWSAMLMSCHGTQDSVPGVFFFLRFCFALLFSSPGLLGIGAGDSSDDDDDDDDGDDDGKRAAGTGAAAAASNPTPAAAAVPEGLPADFFDNADDVGEASEAAAVESLEKKERGAKEMTPTVEFGAERAAVLAAEAAVVAEEDGRREAQKLAVMRAAGLAVPRLDEAAAAAGGGGTVMMDSGAGAGAATVVANGDAAEAAPNGSALPEGFFDDPEIDAKSRGVDLKAKKKEDEQ